jgi:hypothetical protein
MPVAEQILLSAAARFHMATFLHSARRFMAGLPGWKLAIPLAASLLLNVGFVLVWVLQPLPPVLESKIDGGGASEPALAVNAPALETRLRAAGYAEAEARKIAGLVGTSALPAKRADALASANSGQTATPSTNAQSPSENGPASGSRLISIGSAGANPGANRIPSGIQSRNPSPTLRNGDGAQSSPAGGSARAPSANGSHSPALLTSPGGGVTPMIAAPDSTSAPGTFPQRATLTPEQQLYRSLYGWQNYNAALTEEARAGGTP